MEVGLRQRSTPTRSNSPSPCSVSTTTRSTTTVPATTTTTTATTTRWSIILQPPLVRLSLGDRRIWILLHVAAILVYSHGWIRRSMALHNGSECEMTYSYPHFVPIETHFVANATVSASSSTSSSKMSQSYKLYKFVDGRDPRHQSLLKRGTKEQPLVTGSTHCITGSGGGTDGSSNNNNNNRTLVLYIPGHWGSYHQARSLGAHGTQWTRARENPQPGQQALTTGKWSGQTNQLSNFVYEVYSLDFAEQGGAWHASFLEQQCDFLAHVLVYLTTTCHVEHIYLVAHSMGGYVARLLPLRHAHLQRLVPYRITLATPHSNPLYAMDESIHQLHQSLQNHEEEDDDATTNTMVSIAGGMRDEMIAPFACRLEKGYTYSSTTLIKSGRLGMDHRAIVWCHELLDQVRKILWIQSQPQFTPTKQRDRMLVEMLGETVDYDQALNEIKSQSLSQFGSWTTLAMESAMLYNLPILYGMYALLAGFHCAFPEHYSLVATAFLLGILPLLPWTNNHHHHHSPSWSILLILFGVASTIHYLFTWCLLRAVSYQQLSKNHSWQWSWSILFLIMGIILPVLLFLLGGVLWNESWTVSGLASGCLYGAGVIAMILTCLWMVGQSNITAATTTTTTTTFRNKNGALYLAALVLMTVPGILAGSIALMIWEQQVDRRSWWLWARLVLPIVAMGACQKSIATRTITTTPPATTTTTGTGVYQPSSSSSMMVHYWIRGCLLGLVILGTTGSRVLWHGHSFRVAHLVMAVVLTECVWHFFLVLVVDSHFYHLVRNRISNSSKQQ